MLLLEQVLVLVAQRHDRAHVDLVEGREHGGGVLRVLQPARDGLAQPRHLHALFARRRRRRGDGARICAVGTGRGRGRRPRSIAASMSPLVTRPSLPLPGTVEGSMPLSAAILRTDGRDRRFGAALAGAARASAPRPAWPAAAARRLPRASAAAAPSRDLAEQRADRDGLAVLDRDLGEHAGGRRRHFERDLVGFQLDQRLVDRDGFARLLEPFADGRFGDRFAKRGDADVSHDHCPMQSSLFAASSSANADDPVTIQRTQ